MLFFLCASIYYRSNADTFSESVISLDVLIEFLHSLFPQRGAVMGFVHIQKHCKGGEVSHNVMGLPHTGREILRKSNNSAFQHPPSPTKAFAAVSDCVSDHFKREVGVAMQLRLLTVGHGEQRAVRRVHVTCCYIVSLCRPVNGAIILNIKLLNNGGEKTFMFRINDYLLVPNLSARLNE